MKIPDLFSASMQKLGLDGAAPAIAVAVSGGGDSVALTLLMHQWAEKNGAKVHAFTVDHGLRPGSRAEAENLHAALTKRGIRHEILTWVGDKPVTHIQERARAARYALLLDACRRENISLLAVAHNQEDQIETFWMRLSKGSGLDGLAAMAPSRLVDGIRVLRPLIGFTRADLRQVCKDFGAEWVEDPSNANPQFLRVKLRQFEDLLAFEGMTPQRLAQTLQKFEEARDALSVFAERAAEQVLRYEPAGFARLSLPDWKKLPAEIQRRVLSSALMAIAPRDYAPGFEALDQARADMAADGFTGRTLNDCEIFPGAAGEALICREAATASARSVLREGLIWEGAFQVSEYREMLESGAPLEIGILGEEGLSLLRQKNKTDSAFFARLESLPFKVRKTLPALWKGEILVAIPYLNWIDTDAPNEVSGVTVRFLPMERQNPRGA